ncbi:MAG: LuxR C-terminal-related transcriptional regulator [Chloroflexota bacterium]
MREQVDTMISVVVGDGNLLLARTLGALFNAQPDFEVRRSHTDIEQLLDAVTTVNPDIVLLGTDLLLRDFPRCVAMFREGGTQSKLIIMSSKEDESVLEASIRAGAVGYIHGGMPPEEIIEAVRRVNRGDVLFAPQLLVGLLQRPTRPPEDSESAASATPGRREIEVLQALARGMSTQEVSEHLGITTHTVRSHVRNVMVKLQAHTKLDAVMIALREGIISLDQ